MGCRARQRSGRRDPVLSALPAIRIGIGGWDFAGWRGSFYPAGLPKAQELAYASGRLTSIEINATFYRTQSRASFIKWRDSVPDDFVFSLKAPRPASYGRDMEQVSASIARFLESGVAELGPKLGPILWQFPANRRFDEALVARFVAVLPASHDGVALRHAIEAKHESFDDPAYARLLGDHGIADCIVESATQSARQRPTTDLLYVRLQKTVADTADGYEAGGIEAWAAWLQATMPNMPRGVHVYFISGAKERAPDAARALLARFGVGGGERGLGRKAKGLCPLDPHWGYRPQTPFVCERRGVATLRRSQTNGVWGL